MQFQDFSNDIVVSIIHFLDWRDLNRFELVSTQCHKARKQKALDQTREGQIRFRKGDTFVHLEQHPVFGNSHTVRQRHVLYKEVLHSVITGWSAALETNNCKHLVLGDTRGVEIGFTDATRGALFRFPGNLRAKHFRALPMLNTVRSLELTCRQNVDHWARVLCILLPNLEELQLTCANLGLLTGCSTTLNTIRRFCPKLQTIRCTNFVENLKKTSIGYHGWQIRHIKSLRNLHIDGCVLAPRGDFFDFSLPRGFNHAFLSSIRDRLEEVSCQGTQYIPSRPDQPAKDLVRDRENPPDAVPLSQEILMEFVRNAPKLKWFQSDLTKENVAILKQERPEIVFVTSKD